jgi:hypothetical protein
VSDPSLDFPSTRASLPVARAGWIDHPWTGVGATRFLEDSTSANRPDQLSEVKDVAAAIRIIQWNVRRVMTRDRRASAASRGISRSRAAASLGRERVDLL